MEEARGSSSSIEQIARMSRGISYRDMAQLAEMAVSAGGGLKAVAAAEDDDWCGNGRFVIKWPPKRPDDFVALIDKLVELRVDHEVLINGIPRPDELMIHFAQGL
jgi:hypothetical protein